MKKFLKTLAISLAMLTGAVATGSLIAYATTLNFVQTPPTALYSSLAAAGTTMRITPYPKDLDGIKLTMTDFGSSPTVTIDPKKTNYEEIIGFTGIIDNGDNTATLTGLSRDLTSKSPYTTTGTGKQHGAGAIVVFSNNPQMYARFAALENTQTITGLWTFVQTPIGINPGGQPNASETVLGVSELATQIEMASSTSFGGTGGSVVLQAKYATSSPYTTGLYIPITQNNGKLNPNFIATSSTDIYAFGGPVSFASTTMTATTSIAATSLTNGALTLHGLPYTFPSSRGVANSVLTENGSGALTWGGISVPHYAFASTSVGLTVSANCSNCGSTNNTATTSQIMVIPAGVLTASSTIHILVNSTCSGSKTGTGSWSCNTALRTSSGAPIWQDGGSANNYGLAVDTLSLSPSNQVSMYICSSATGLGCTGGTSNSTVDFTAGLSLVFVERVFAAGGGGDVGNGTAGISNFSVIVNP